MKIGYIISRFPSVFQPWVAQELLATHQSGYEICIFSLKKPHKNIGHNNANLLGDKVYYAPFFISKNVLLSTLSLFIKRPSVFIDCIYTTFKGYRSDKMNLIKSISVLPKAIHYASVIKDSGVTHIHAHWATIPALSALIISKITNLKFSLTCHAIDIFDETTMLQEKLEAAKFIVTCTGYNKKYLMYTYPSIGADKIYTNYHGKDLSQLKKQCHQANKDPNILSVGRLSESKGYRYVLRAIRDLRDKYGINAYYTLVGDGPMRKNIEDLVAEYELEKTVTITGALSYQDVIKYYEKADIFVLAMVANPEFGYPHRGIPNVIAEALAMEIPVITTKLPAIDELIQDGINGILVEEKNINELTEALKFLILSPEKRLQMGSHGRKKVKELFDINKTIKELVDIFDKELRYN